MRKAKRTILIAMLFCLIPALARAQVESQRTPKKYTAQELIAKIIASEKKIHDVELHFDDILVGRGNHVYRSLDWGYQGGKKYSAGKVFNLGVPERNIPAWKNTERKAFDGEKFCSMSDKTNFRNGQVLKKGLVGAVGPDRDIFGNLYPTRLLGYELVKKRPVSRTTVTLGDLLSTARKVSVKPELENIDGHLCTVVEAIGVKDVAEISSGSGVRYEDCTWEVRTWIDTGRDFRPLRIERYYGDKGPLSVGGRNRWQVLSCRIEKIKLEKIDGVWFPVDGIATWFSTKTILPPDRMTEDEFRRLARKKQRSIGKFIQESRTGPRRMRVYHDTVRINKGIDPGKFTIEFPQGCEVWDEFRIKKYTIGKEGDPALDANSSGSSILQRLADFKVGLDPEQVKGKRILICFWRMGDARSAQTLRHLRERANDLADTGVVLALVHAVPAKAEKIKTWLSRNQIPFDSGVVENRYIAGSLWSVESLPSLALTDAEHLLIAKGFGPDELDQKLRESNCAKR